MAPRKGKTNNPHGRPKGVPNKVTKEIRPLIRDFIRGEMENIDKLVVQLDPKDRITLILKLLEFIIPQAAPGDNFDNQGGSNDYERNRFYDAISKMIIDEGKKKKQETLTNEQGE